MPKAHVPIIKVPATGKDLVYNTKPIHRRRGRPQKARAKISSSKINLEARKNAIKHNKLRKTVRKDPASLNVLDLLITEMSLELANLSFERDEAVRKGESTFDFSKNRVSALNKTFDMVLKKRSAVLDKAIDLSSDAFARFLEWFISQITLRLREGGINDETIHILLALISEIFDDEDRWIKEAEAAIKSTQ
jgi:hypothetical protein